MDRLYIRCLCLLLPLLLPAVAAAQGDPMPEFRNPTSFASTGTNPQNFRGWSARVGDRVNSGASTGYDIKSTCTFSNCPDIIGHDSIMSSQYNTGPDLGINCCGHTELWDAAQDHRFMIITEPGIDQMTLRNGEGMPRIPEGYTSSIRLGDPRAARRGSVPSSVTEWGTFMYNEHKSSEALFYTMKVRPDNALVFINYAVVGRCFGHAPEVAGEFTIRVVGQDPNTLEWPNEPINDDLWFRVSAPNFAENPPAPWVRGLPYGNTFSCADTYCEYVYKPWAKVAISLNAFLYDNVRIEIYTSDCVPTVDPIYAYICGDYQPMTLTPSGCPKAESSVVDTIRAPQGMLSYAWYVSARGAVPDGELLHASYMDTVPFRQVWPPQGGADTSTTYAARFEDFIIADGDHAGDTVAIQTFKCVMTSALDPNKPFESRIYVNLINRRPHLGHSYEVHCDTSITFNDATTVLVADGLEVDSTHWVFYADTLGLEPLDTVWGTTFNYHFPSPGRYGVRHFATTAVEPCTAAEFFVCEAFDTPPAAFTVADNLICESDLLQVHASDTVRQLENVTLQWAVDDSVLAYTTPDAAFPLPLGDYQISLTVANAAGCSSVATDSVQVLGLPTINLSSSVNAICQGDSVTLTGAGDISYTWNSAPYDSTLDAVQGQNTFTVAPTVNTTYFLLPSGDNPCSVDGAYVNVEVVPYPTPVIYTYSQHVDRENGTLICRDASPYSERSFWTFSDGGTATGSTVTHSFADLSSDSVWVFLQACNRLGCCDTTTRHIPVKLSVMWFPNAFTPGEGSNNRFGPHTSLSFISYEIYIYNRQGQLVHYSDNPADPWDGTVDGGGPAPQGTYTWFCRYSYSADATYTAHGSVTLIR